MHVVRAPNRSHNGISAGVRFTAGVGETDNPAALAYFRRAGYTVEPAGASPVIATLTIADIAPGPVAVAEPDVQEKVETKIAEDVLVEGKSATLPRTKGKAKA